jgi:hypothetical protein
MTTPSTVASSSSGSFTSFEGMEADLAQVAKNDSMEPSSDLATSIDEVAVAFDLFFTNDLKECLGILTEKSSTSLYHSLGETAAKFLYCLLTFDRKDMDDAKEAVKNAVNITRSKRRSTYISEYLWGAHADNYTNEEIHAELCYAEIHTLYGFLTLFTDPSVFNTIKAAYRIKVGNDTYR